MAAPVIVLPAGWRIAYTPDGKQYFQNELTHETSWDPPQPVPIQVIQSYTPQPIVPIVPVQTIQSHTPQPIVPMETIQSRSISASNEPSSPSANTIQETMYKKQKVSRKQQLKSFIAKCQDLWESIPKKIKVPILLIIGIVFTWNDFTSDCDVASILWSMADQSLCAKFQCNDYSEISTKLSTSGYALFLAACIGVIAELRFKWRKLKLLVKIFKSKDDKDPEIVEMEENNDTDELEWGWVPLIAEDIASLGIMLWVSGVTTNIVGLSGKYLKSVLWSLLTVSKSLIMTGKTHWSFRKKGVFEQKRKCHGCWFVMTFSCILIIGGWDIAQIITYHDPQPWLNLQLPAEHQSNVTNEYAKSKNDTIQCLYGTDEIGKVEDIFGLNNIKTVDKIYGDVVRAPKVIYGYNGPYNFSDTKYCNGADFIYSIICSATNVRGIDENAQLNCTLSWEFDEDRIGINDTNTTDTNMTTAGAECDNDCLFFIPFEHCYTLTIICEEPKRFIFGKYESGLPQMFTCWDYCESPAAYFG